MKKKNDRYGLTCHRKDGSRTNGYVVRYGGYYRWWRVQWPCGRLTIERESDLVFEELAQRRAGIRRGAQ